MPTYLYTCDPSFGGCGNSFELKASMNDVSNLKPTCKSCRKRKPVRRDFCGENHTILDGTPKTLGTLAERNSQVTSVDEQASIHRKHNEYKNKQLELPLGPGMSQVERTSQGEVIVSKSQTKRDKRKKK